ncbi:MAG TPA: hypothetical protein VLE69_01700 [Candidatus Saccharimonadales bacterium]|nr:hypothetical protein [Candidatus Saccharimonadales bacterium]
MSSASWDSYYKWCQIEVFGAERIAALEGHEATPDSVEELLCVIGSLAVESGDRLALPESINHRLVYREVGEPLHVQTNPNHVPAGGFGSTEEDFALATIYGLKVGKTRIFMPRRYLRPGVYAVREDIYVDRDKNAKILKCFSPLYGNVVREILNRFTEGIAARKLASEEEVQEALDIVSQAVHYDDKIQGKGLDK